MPGVKKISEIPAKVDQRTQVGLQRREKMRKRLLTAGMASYAQQDHTFQPNIDDVALEANVSRQRFFRSMSNCRAISRTLRQS